MPHEHPPMKSFRAAAAAFAVAATLAGPSCTKPNPRSCADGICNDPSLPFCDVEGVLGGEPKECIAVSCTPDMFEACRGNDELRCNMTGNNYDTTKCELGCGSETNGCKLCFPNETRCTNGRLATCDSTGIPFNEVFCELGCFEDKPRCRRIDPSNKLGGYLDLVADPKNYDLTNAGFDTTTGIVTHNSMPLDIPSFAAANGDGPTIRVFIVNNLRLNGGTVGASNHPSGNGPAMAIVARGTITIEGRFVVHGSAGGVANPTCAGGPGSYFETGSSTRSAASGGGGNATAGMKGGNIGTFLGGAGGQAHGTDSLVPLKGGCPAGGLESGYATDASRGVGGGALQLTSEKSISILGIIDARGQSGSYEQAGSIGAAYFGGGAGGSILLEAPSVNLGASAVLMAKGGGGASVGPSASDDDTASAALGVVCPGNCADGGNGATVNIAATPGEPSPTSTGSDLVSGGGGGGLGRVRINTRDTTYQRLNTTVEAAMVTSGLIQTR
jgi:hypothetical protein